MAQQIKKDKSFKVHINQGEMYQIQEWVSKHRNIETGGDLFGLWLDDHTAVVQFVLGPGKKCRRAETSFFQDVKYLQQAGSYLTDKHGLCNIGQWHSHHRLSLSKPSHGDENTVWRNMPVLGLNRYIVFIANITNKVTVNCFLFHYQGRKRSLTEGQFKYLDGNSPLRLNEMVLQNTFVGLESFIQPEMFESEMKFLRNNDDNMKTSLEDEKQNAEQEKCTTPNMSKLENCKDKSPKEQPHDTSTFATLQHNDTKDDNVKTYTKEQSSTNTSTDHEQYNKNSLKRKNAAQDNHDSLCKSNMGTCPEKKARDDKSIPVVDEQYNENFSRRGNVQENNDTRKDDNAKAYTKNVSVGREQEKSNVPRYENEKNNLGNSNEDNNENYKGNENQYDTSISIKHEPNRRDNDEKDDACRFKEDNIRTKTEHRQQSNTNILTAHEQNNRNSLRGENDDKDNNVIVKDENAETSNENSETSNANTSFEPGEHTENTEQDDISVSEAVQDNRNSLQSDNDAKGDNNFFKDDNVKAYTENRKNLNANTSFEPGGNKRNSLPHKNDKEDKLDLSNKDNVETHTGNTEQHDTSVSVEEEQDYRNYLQSDHVAKDNNNILKDENAETSNENSEKSNANTSFEPGKHNINSSPHNNDNVHETHTGNTGQYNISVSVEDGKHSRNFSLQSDNVVKDKQDISNEDNVGTFTAETNEYDDNGKNDLHISNVDNIGNDTENTEQHDKSSSVEDGQKNRESLRGDKEEDNIGTFTGENKQSNKDNRYDRNIYDQNGENISRESSPTRKKELNNHKNESPQKVSVTIKHTIGTSAENTEQYHGSNSVQIRQQNRKSLRCDKDAKDYPGISNQDNIGTFAGNKKQSNEDSRYGRNICDEHDQNRKNISREPSPTRRRELKKPDNDSFQRVSVTMEIIEKHTIGTSTDKTEQYDVSNSVKVRQQDRKSLRGNKDAKDDHGISNQDNIGTFAWNREQSNEDSRYGGNIYEHDQNRKNILREPSPTRRRELKKPNNDSFQRVSVTAKHVPKHKLINGTEQSRGTNENEEFLSRQTASETCQRSPKNYSNEARSNTYELNPNTKQETSVSTSSPVAKSNPQKPIYNSVINENAGIRQSRRSLPNEETAQWTNNASLEYYNQREKPTLAKCISSTPKETLV